MPTFLRFSFKKRGAKSCQSYRKYRSTKPPQNSKAPVPAKTPGSQAGTLIAGGLASMCGGFPSCHWIVVGTKNAESIPHSTPAAASAYHPVRSK
jgi:hypothetical protein